MNAGSVILGVGSYLPETRWGNDRIEQLVDTTDAWIRERTGITCRYIAAEGQLTSDLAAEAARKAVSAAGISADAVDLIIVATATPDQTMPATACKVQALLGAAKGAAFDVNAACSGFVYALLQADSMIRSGLARHALVIGAETFSRVVDWKDRGTCILFGDGAGAVVLGPAEAGSNRGILGGSLYADGALGPLIETTGGVSMNQQAGVVLMQGQEVFRHAVGKMCDALKIALERSGLGLEDVDFLVPHQANARILNAIAQRLNMPPEKVILTVGEHANTSAASIPLALSHGVASGRIQKGHVLALQALGAGLTWGACILRW